MTRFMREDAVSPVLGVILMVAITVILAAVIASFVFGMSQNIKTAPYIGVTARQVGTSIYITYAVAPSSMEDVTNMTVRVNGVYNGSIENPVVGETMTLAGAGTPENDNVIVVATFTDGRQVIALNTDV